MFYPIKQVSILVQISICQYTSPVERWAGEGSANDTDSFALGTKKWKVISKTNFVIYYYEKSNVEEG